MTKLSRRCHSHRRFHATFSVLVSVHALFNISNEGGVELFLVTMLLYVMLLLSIAVMGCAINQQLDVLKLQFIYSLDRNCVLAGLIRNWPVK